ncbi:MAG: bifunctional methylenetetrahydrofolate dehydrogenase/methenyltetrahydrofolate cyclohydrolase FolD [Planctomycetota bacterium]
MTAQLLDGKAISESLQHELKETVSQFVQKRGVKPTLAAVLVGDNGGSEVYVRNKRRACERVGLDSQLHRLPADVSESQLLALVDQLNRDERVHGILVQLPLPDGRMESRVLDAIHPLKDVDAFHPHNVGLLSQGRPRFLPCTPHGVLQILQRSQISVVGRRVVIVGRSDIVGKPLAMLLGAKDSPVGPDVCNATVTVCHSRTPDLLEHTRAADVLVAAIGRPRMITAEMVKPQAVVIDVGINRLADGIVGDVDFDAVREVASAITPVPGGVGPLTVTMLLFNTLRAAELLVA